MLFRSLAHGDAKLLGKNRVNVVHCPRSHDFFRHTKFELQRLANAGVNLCLGTDSLATIRKDGKKKPELNLFTEMQALADKEKGISPEEILKMATANGARALGLEGKLGALEKKNFADLIALPCPEKTKDIFEAVIHHQGKVSASVIEGEWVIPPA